MPSVHGPVSQSCVRRATPASSTSEAATSETVVRRRPVEHQVDAGDAVAAGDRALDLVGEVAQHALDTAGGAARHDPAHRALGDEAAASRPGRYLIGTRASTWPRRIASVRL